MNTFAILVISTFRLQEAATSEVSATEVFNTSDIDEFRCCVAEILDNLAGDKKTDNADYQCITANVSRQVL